MVSQALAPLVEQRRNPKQPQDMRPPAIITNLSARVGSISDNNLGGWYSYRASKAALNQATRCMALELKRKHVWTVALHPGTTQTDLSLPFSKNVQEGRMFPVDFTVERLLSVVECTEEEHSGVFFDWAGIALHDTTRAIWVLSFDSVIPAAQWSGVPPGLLHACIATFPASYSARRMMSVADASPAAKCSAVAPLLARAKANLFQPAVSNVWMRWWVVR